MRLHGGRDAIRPAGEEAQPRTALLMQREITALVMRERRCRLLVALGQRHPRLDRVDRSARASGLLEALGVGDTPTRGHPVDLGGADGLLVAERVTVHDLAGE